MHSKDTKMNFWNIKNLHLPPINTYKAEDTEVDIEHLTKIFREAVEFFDTERHLSTEYKVVSITVYRMKQKFRSSKDFKAFEKLYKSLNHYFKTNILKDLRNFVKLIPARYTTETYLPNKNMLDYILVRLQGIAKLLERIKQTCMITADLFDKRTMFLGHSWNIGLLVFSLVSRIYILTKFIAKFICGFYNKIYPFSYQLKNRGRKWLPKNYILPKDLQKWLNADWLDIDDEVQIIEETECPNITQFFDLVADDEDDVQFCQEYVMIDDDDTELVNAFIKLEDIEESIQKMRGFDMDEDIGEIIEVNDDSSLFDESAALARNDEISIPNVNISENLSQTEPKENNERDFGEVIEINDSFYVPLQKSESKSNEVVILDSSFDFKENCSEMTEVIDLGSSSQTIKENDVDTSDNSEIVNILDNSPSETDEMESSATSPFPRVLKPHTNFNSINLDNEVVTVPDSPVMSKKKRRQETLLQTDCISSDNEDVTPSKSSVKTDRNNKMKKGVKKKKKNLKKDNVTISKKSLPMPSTISKRNSKKQKPVKKKKLKNDLITVSGKSPSHQTDCFTNDAESLPTSSVTNKTNSIKKKPVKTLSNSSRKIEVNKSASKTHTLFNPPVIDFCGNGMPNIFNGNKVSPNVENLRTKNKITFNPYKKRNLGDTSENAYKPNIVNDDKVLSNVEDLRRNTKIMFNPNKKRKLGVTSENSRKPNILNDNKILSNVEDMRKTKYPNPNNKRKLEDTNASSSKKAKKSKNSIVENSAKKNQNKLFKNVQFNEQNLDVINAHIKTEKEQPILIKKEVEGSGSGVKRDKSKLKKTKNAKIKALKNSVSIVKQANSLKHRTNKQYNTQQFTINHLSIKKEKR